MGLRLLQVNGQVQGWEVMVNCDPWIAGVYTLPPDEGIPLSGGGKTSFYMVFERHYYNPTNKVAWWSSKGF